MLFGRSFKAQRAALLLAALAAGCNNSARDETEEANRLVDEMNAGAEKAEQVSRESAAKAAELDSKNPEKEGDDILRLAQEQAGRYKQTAELYRDAASKAEQASRLKTSDWYRDYLALKAQHFRKLAEVADALREDAELWVNERDLDAIGEKSAAIDERSEKLAKEAEELAKQVQKAAEEHKDEITK